MHAIRKQGTIERERRERERERRERGERERCSAEDSHRRETYFYQTRRCPEEDRRGEEEEEKGGEEGSSSLRCLSLSLYLYSSLSLSVSHRRRGSSATATAVGENESLCFGELRSGRVAEARMLRKRSRPAHKDQAMGDAEEVRRLRSTSFFNLPGLFVGYGKSSGDSDAARSPISPLDLKVFSGVGSHFGRSPRSPEGSQKSWDSGRVGLGLVDSLSDSSGVLMGAQMKMRIVSVANPRSFSPRDRLLFDGSETSPRSLPKNYVISSAAAAAAAAAGCGGGNGEKQQEQSFSAQRGFISSLSASDIEQSEDYTCIISHGPNPKTTHIFGDCVLETSDFIAGDQHEEGTGSSWILDCAEDLVPLPGENFLSVCHSCKKKLDGEDIYMYRGEKAFCSSSCRSQEIMEEEMEESARASSSGSNCSGELLPWAK